MELNDKIGIVDKEMFHRMLGIKAHENLPDFLLVEYFRVKKLIDKVSGNVGVFGLAQIAMDCGFDPDEMEFDFKAHTIEATAIPLETATLSSGANTSDWSPPETGEATDEITDTLPGPLYENGETVEIIQDEEILQGRVVDKRWEDEAWMYTVECDNEETYEVAEDEIGEK